MSAQDPGGEKRSLPQVAGRRGRLGAGVGGWFLDVKQDFLLGWQPLLPCEGGHASCPRGGSLEAGRECKKEGNGCPVNREGQRPCREGS